jgi:hypothetical protein
VLCAGHVVARSYLDEVHGPVQCARTRSVPIAVRDGAAGCPGAARRRGGMVQRTHGHAGPARQGQNDQHDDGTHAVDAQECRCA